MSQTALLLLNISCVAQRIRFAILIITFEVSPEHCGLLSLGKGAQRTPGLHEGHEEKPLCPLCFLRVLCAPILQHLKNSDQ